MSARERAYHGVMALAPSLTGRPPVHDDFAGFDLAPTSPEFFLAGLGSCIAHSALMVAARLGLRLDPVEVRATGTLDPRGGYPGHDDIPVEPHHLAYSIGVGGDLTPTEAERLRRDVERTCPIHRRRESIALDRFRTLVGRAGELG